VNEEKESAMNLKPIVLLLFCCLSLAGAVGIAFSQEKPSPADPGTVKLNATVVSIPEDDEFYVGKEKVTQADIPVKIKQILKDTPPEEQVVYVKARCHVKYGIVVTVVDAIREAGFKSIGLVTDKRNRAGKSPASAAESLAGDDKKIAADPTSVQGNIAARQMHLETVLVEVESKSLTRLNSEAISLARLRVTLERLLRGRSDKTVFIKAPKAMTYCDVLKVIDTVKGAGAQPIGLQVGNLK
jgi:biopolymer transport protein ExbD